MKRIIYAVVVVSATFVAVAGAAEAHQGASLADKPVARKDGKAVTISFAVTAPSTLRFPFLRPMAKSFGSWRRDCLAITLPSLSKKVSTRNWFGTVCKFTPAKSIEWRVAPVSLPPRTDGKYDPAKCQAMLEDTKAEPKDRLSAASRLLCAERLKRPIDLTALKIGDVYILHLPGEPMIEFQLYAQRQKPDAFVAVAGYGLGSPGYICTEKSFSEGAYEPSASATKPCAEGIMKAGINQLLRVE